MTALAEIVRSAQFAYAYELFQASMRQFGPPSFHLAPIFQDGQRLPVRQTVVAETPFCRLLRFSVGEGKGVQRMLCAPLAGHRAVVVGDAIESMLADADVYVTDWIDARDVPPEAGRFGLDDCVLVLERFMALLGPANLDVVAICQGTVPALAAVARLAASGAREIRALALMGGPLDARLRPTRLGRIAAAMPVPVFLSNCTGAVPPGYPGAGRVVYPGFLQLPTLASGQPERLFSLMLDALPYLWLGHRSVDQALRTNAGYGAMMDMPVEFLLDTMRIVFREYLLPRGLWWVDGVLVSPASMRTTRLLTVEGKLDTITGAGQTHATHALCTGLTDRHRAKVTVPGCDHYDLFCGDVWRNRVYPALRAWLEEPAQCRRSDGSLSRAGLAS
ncbi:polyhydroxyalkanoate depolymerase [Cupriavidus sp. WKF15]|uniref:polyhydroxyalkanoate depolymerase n=1 Tax=Cupriavidus sp. WKF15 TaxID=3032282 RepID=UPI0023E1D7D8|nr:polyhydroxyalkanoate depolymerase [Cupriavidus sp. WKF15]WER50175.1 polyhydroxyalkanoate depolymerase [Cupriavidus sp. WKF15]